MDCAACVTQFKLQFAHSLFHACLSHHVIAIIADSCCQLGWGSFSASSVLQFCRMQFQPSLSHESMCQNHPLEGAGSYSRNHPLIKSVRSDLMRGRDLTSEIILWRQSHRGGGTVEAKPFSHQVCALRLDEREQNLTGDIILSGGPGGAEPYKRNHPLIKSERSDLMRGGGTVEAKPSSHQV